MVLGSWSLTRGPWFLASDVHACREMNKELPHCDLQAAERLGCLFIFGHVQGGAPFEAKGAGGGTISVPHALQYIYAEPGCQDLP